MNKQTRLCVDCSYHYILEYEFIKKHLCSFGQDVVRNPVTGREERPGAFQHCFEIREKDPAAERCGYKRKRWKFWRPR